MGEVAPAFSFYAKDFISGTAALSTSEVGAYIRLLAYQWDNGSVPDGAAALSRICGCTSVQAGKLWAVIGGKFERGEDGRWRNPRLERERVKQATYREAQRANGKLGGRPRGEPP